MISERKFSRSFHGFWAELLPLLTPSFVHMFNEGFREKVVDRHGFAAGAVMRAPDSDEAAVIAEFAFFLAKETVAAGSDVADVFRDDGLRERALARAVAEVARYEGGEGAIYVSLGASEEAEVLALGINYDIFLCSQEGEVGFCPRVPGAGFIASCEGDISIGDCLFEVKTVERNIAGKDIRQLMTYLALQAATGDRRWRRAGFFNPRRAEFHEFDVDDLVMRMSGGRPAIEVFQELVRFTSSRDIELDSAF